MGATFEIIRTRTAYTTAEMNLVQQKVIVSPAKPQIQLVQVPGANGSVDLTDALTTDTKYSDRTITWTFAVLPNVSWFDTMALVSNRINGKRCRITLDEDPDWYYEGRVEVTTHTTDKLLRQITVVATCQPFKIANARSAWGDNLVKTTHKTKTIDVGEMSQIPVFSCNYDTNISWDGITVLIQANTPTQPPAFYWTGETTFEYWRAGTGEYNGKLTLEWFRGSL